MPTTPMSSENTSLVTSIPYRKLSYTTVIGKNVLNGRQDISNSVFEKSEFKALFFHVLLKLY